MFLQFPIFHFKIETNKKALLSNVQLYFSCTSPVLFHTSNLNQKPVIKSKK
jgi:hypothetical protein